MKELNSFRKRTFQKFKEKAEKDGITLEEAYKKLARDLNLKEGDMVAVGGVPYIVKRR